MVTTALNADELLQSWKEERAHRVGLVISRAGAAFAVIATLADVYFQMPNIVLLGDIALLGGCFLSFFISKKSHIDSGLRWIPFYFGVWAATFTSLWVTGGVQSPFIGTYLTILYVTGVIIQIHIRPRTVTLFILANLLFWVVAELTWTGDFGAAPPTAFIFLINAIVIAAIMISVFEFQRTEKNLAVEILKQYQTLSKARENLNREELANVAKTNFLANISHELRTPLGAILGFSELIQDSNISAAEKNMFAETIRRNGAQLSRLVDDLLDLSKVEMGKIELEPVDFNLTQIFSEVIQLFSAPAQKKNIQLNLTIAESLPGRATSDPIRLKQILTNIIGNAIKFTEKGHININAFYEPSGSLLRVDVKDTGRGLTQEEQSRLFKPFSQADASVTRKYGGTGLGLNLSRKLAQLLGGNLQLLWSQPGKGSCFRLEIPLHSHSKLQQSPQEIPITDSQPSGPLDTYRILVVDDIADNQKLLCRYLEKAGASVDVASDGVEGIQKATQSDFDLILMDVQMPVLDGLQATTILRQKHYEKPIFAVTAHAMKEDRDRCLAAGFNDYLTKPLNQKNLVDKIKQALQA